MGDKSKFYQKGWERLDGNYVSEKNRNPYKILVDLKLTKVNNLISLEKEVGYWEIKIRE